METASNRPEKLTEIRIMVMDCRQTNSFQIPLQTVTHVEQASDDFTFLLKWQEVETQEEGSLFHLLFLEKIKVFPSRVLSYLPPSTESAFWFFACNFKLKLMSDWITCQFKYGNAI